MSVIVHADNKVTDSLEVRCYEVDGGMRLKPSAFMDMAQEMAYQAAAAMHFGYDELIAEGMAWVLSRMHFKFVDTPVWRDKVEIQTWHRGAVGPFFVRDFKLLGEDGHEMVLGTSSWVVLDVESRRMARPEDILPTESTICHDFAIESPAAKVMMPRGASPELVATHKVAYSDIDLVGHTNNARYISWAMDCMDYGPGGIAVDEVEVVFHHEAVPGDEVTLYRLSEEDSVIVEGRTPDKQIFCARLWTEVL